MYTDQYQLTMAQLYFRLGLHERPAQFDYFYRRNPDYGAHQAGYCVHAGLEWLLDWMRAARFDDDDIAYLQSQKEPGGARIFADDFLAWLRAHGNFDGITLRAIPEGRVVHPNAPLAIVQGPLAMAQILETSLLNHLNYPTLVATKAERMHQSARGRLLMEFGLRRGQERGANAGARAALIGGADFSSMRTCRPAAPALMPGAARYAEPRKFGPAARSPGAAKAARDSGALLWVGPAGGMLAVRFMLTVPDAAVTPRTTSPCAGGPSDAAVGNRQRQSEH